MNTKIVPKMVRVGAVTFSVSILDETTGEADCYGWMSKPSAKIYLASDLSDDMARSTLMHEIFHCAFMQANHHLRYKAEEQVISAVEPLITDSLLRRENNSLRSFLLEGVT
jgi:Zn-dependent peptidase ImmA (M78 family)